MPDSSGTPLGGLAMLFARRYLFSRGSHSVINIISRVSAVAIGVPVAAMVVLLSVFNGFEGLVRGMYNDFDPDLSIVPARGKVFSTAEFDIDKVSGHRDVRLVSMVLEDNALLQYRGRQFIATVLGVDTLYADIVPIRGMITGGEYQLMYGSMEEAVVGSGLAANLGVNTALYDMIEAWVPRRGRVSPLVPVEGYRVREAFPAGVFALDAQTDTKYMIAPISFARALFDYPDGASSAMVALREGSDPDRARDQIAQLLGDGYKVLTRHEQKASVYLIMKYEKWGIFFIIFLVLVIASFCLVGSLAMLMIDKRDERCTLAVLGADARMVRGIFTREGMLISCIGAAGGMAVGLALCWAQRAFSLVRLPEGTFLVEAYPVTVKFSDMVLVACAFIAVNYIITKFTVVKMLPRGGTGGGTGV